MGARRNSADCTRRLIAPIDSLAQAVAHSQFENGGTKWRSICANAAPRIVIPGAVPRVKSVCAAHQVGAAGGTRPPAQAPRQRPKPVRARREWPTARAIGRA